ncbi:glycoside hydrolase family 3 N-terminal domain-containing protein [Streptomyces sp. P17]|uniref:glycoside hydrolase family 3 N-terminal domain-containing protein n=1 Tax=Streptomyces sp. P17 TaxID=3074716 RepID=UPI0028F429D9|nr:glycoside hydrolase family 3 N-terminal domain-containing protein [Streptomyces sp. P17]MDT9698266.1 glycoside hydrolase family 3 N-terminal domain-containing protein [Streptomyces sp. P17]
MSPSRTLSTRRPTIVAALCAATLALTGLAAAPPVSSAPRADVPTAVAALPYQDPSLPVPERVDDLLSRMTLDDKLGQMTQIEKDALAPQSDLAAYRIGSVLSGGDSTVSPNNARTWADTYDSLQRTALGTPLGIPMIYGIDAVHGHNAVRGATLFPHNIGLGATRDPALVQRVGRAVAEEVAGTGIDWSFAPCLCVARNDRWGRTYESFGEKPELPASMATFVTGMQGQTLGGDPASVLATAKHYLGDGGTTGGVDQGNTELSETELRAIHLPPFQEAVRRGVGSVMLSYSSWNGVKSHAHKYLVTDVLKGELGFTGFVVSDWAAVDQLDGQSGFTGAEITTVVNAGVDMVMVPHDYKKFLTLLRGEVTAGRIAQARVDDANRRILTKKFQLGLFERPLTDRSLTPGVGSAEHRALARQAVRQSQVLLKNDGGVLPLAKNAKLFVAGKSADDIGNQSGGWTLGWQGRSGPVTEGTTILQGIRAAATDPSRITYDRYGNGIDGSYTAAVAVVGETPYAEMHGDRPGGMGLDQEDLQTLARLKASGVPVVVVLVSGRPLDWVKPPGESDGASKDIPNQEGKRADPMCDPDYTAPNAGNNKTGALPGAPLAGHWFHNQVSMLVRNAYPAVPTGGTDPGDTTAPTAPTGLRATAKTASSVSLAWSAATDNVGVTGYDVYRDGARVTAQPVSGTTFTDTGLSAATAYRYTVRARDAAGNVSAASAALGVTTETGGGPDPTGGLKIAYKNNDASATDNAIRPGLRITNTGSAALALTEVTARYYFTRDGGSPTVSAWCDYAAVGCSNVKLRAVPLSTPVAGADAYLEVGFSAGSLAAGRDTGDIQLRMAKSDWSAFNEADDHSRTTATSYTDAPAIPGYLGTVLAWGAPPA